MNMKQRSKTHKLFTVAFRTLGKYFVLGSCFEACLVLIIPGLGLSVVQPTDESLALKDA